MRQLEISFASGARAVAQFSRRESIGAEVQGRTCWLAVSMKSRRFSKQLVEDFLSFAANYSMKPLITVVDLPYAYNAIASASSFEELEVQLERLKKVRDETHRRITKVIRRTGRDCEYLSWRSLVAETPRSFCEEVFQAMNERQEFREGVYTVAKGAIPDGESAVNLSAYSQFFLSELPTIIYMYAVFRRGVVDFYPGPNPRIVRGIIDGEYRDVMPSISEALCNANEFVFVEYQD